jgi:hypothetical protein
MTLVYVTRDENGVIKGVFAGRQEIAQEAIDDLAEGCRHSFTRRLRSLLFPPDSSSSTSLRLG